MSTLIEILESLSGGSGVARRLDAGEMLFTTGDPVRSLFVVETGQLRLLRHTEHGATLTLHVAQPGEAFAEASLFSRTYHCDAAADVSSLVRAYPKRALLRALREDSGAALALTGHLARQVQALRGHIEFLNIKSARDRVLGYLHNHLSASAKHVELERTWKAIATEIGLTHEAVYRALAELERDGRIERDGKAVVLRKP
ncbi:MAG: protein kinase [Geminicoccaceae bacterium]|jgi:CRP-like cAMP-binding protein|nr:protein kinase [Microvirga sp.]MCE3248199.1 protein kinase [Geminicoccaceae bacterium]